MHLERLHLTTIEGVCCTGTDITHLTPRGAQVCCSLAPHFQALKVKHQQLVTTFQLVAVDLS